MDVIGYHASHEQFPPSALLEWVALAEQAGFDAAMCSDHLAPWGVRQGESGFSWSWLGAALARTSFSIGSVSSPVQRMHPVVSAQAIATLEEMFPGRFWTALGSGEALNEHVTGDGWPEKPERDRRLDEAQSVIARLLAGEKVTHDGRVRVHEARLWTRPAEPPPLFAAAVSVETAVRVAPWADGLATVAQPRETLERVLTGYRDAGGRGPAALQVHVCLTDDLDAGMRTVRDQWRHGALPPTRLWDISTPEEFDAAASDVTDEELRESVLISDDADELAARIADLVSVGFDRVYLHEVGPDQRSFIERAGRELLPALRAIA